jgi:hypothetical protein
MDSPVKVYSDAVAAAKKAVGKDGTLTNPRVDVGKVAHEVIKVKAGFDKARVDVETQLVSFETALAKLRAAAKQYSDLVDGDSFDLDAKDTKNKKTIIEVTKIILDAMSEIEQDADTVTDRLDKLDKVMTDMRRLGK